MKQSRERGQLTRRGCVFVANVDGTVTERLAGRGCVIRKTEGKVCAPCSSTWQLEILSH